MFKQLFGTRRTTKVDLFVGVIAAVAAVSKAIDNFNQYKAEQADDQKENNQ